MRRFVFAAVACMLFFCGCTASGTTSSQTGNPVILPASETQTKSSYPVSSESEIQSQSSQNISSDTTAPVTLEVSSEEIRPGEFLIIRVGGSGENALWARFSEVTSKVFPLIQEDGFFIGFVPLSSTTTKTGDVEILRSEDGEYEVIAHKAIQFIDRTFDRQDLTVVSGSSTANAGSSSNLSDDKEIIEQATKTSPQELLFTGGFVMPAQGRISTQYGMRRYTNEEYSSAHSGYDIAADEGDPVIAAGAGRIAYAGNLKFYGNTVIIAHGFNIFSYYNHLSV
ncbi:MAG TPA: M23 family metallopeptidase, partial [Clostridiales bacterium]|nr:M23 family metallopeptidase [Clostridiales bacterium]